jgi:hypothetical protein
LECELYNAALEERRGAWRWEQRSVSYVDQCRTLTSLRAARLVDGADEVHQAFIARNVRGVYAESGSIQAATGDLKL